MSRFFAEIMSKPVVQRFATIGVLFGTTVGGISGLVRGLEVRPATAWFAVFEIGVPAAIVCGLLGFVCGLAVTSARRVRSHMSRGFWFTWH